MSEPAPDPDDVGTTGPSGVPVPDVGELLDLAVIRLGGVRRDGQQRLASAVAHALETHEHLMVQAGTGTGKSLGYLVPAVRHAVTAQERVVVSTATLALQRQVVTRDLPLVTDAVAPQLPRAPQVALLKGWHNYLCRHKLTGGYPVDDGPTLFDVDPAADHPDAGAGPGAGTLGAHVLRLRQWAEETESGDRDDLVPGVPDRAWRQVSVRSMECLGPTCPLVSECFAEQARERAHQADVVVTNHAMLGIAASGSPGVLPEHHVLVVDEAHELAERVTAQATTELSAVTVELAARLARRHGGVATTDLDAAGSDLGSLLVQTPEGRFKDGLPAALGAAVGAVRDAARALLTALRPDGARAVGPQAGNVEGGRKMAVSAVLALFEVAERMTGDATGHDVVWCSRGDGGRGGGPRLHAAPLAVHGLVRANLLTGRTAVLTSATLALGGSFTPLARTAGLDVDQERTGPPSTTVVERSHDPQAPRPWHGVDVGSPFDHARAGILYVARHLPPPGREPATASQLDELAGLLEASGGATLGLFSSRRAAEVAAEALRERLDLPILCQGDDQLPTLVQQFAADDATSLFGTLSLWQGVDVPGPTCRLVVVDRIPFPRPDDPIRSARSEAVEAGGGNGFMSVSATHAALLLAQGAGRLLRRDTDRGVVAVLDARLATARYGTYLVRSMPPFWRTTDPAVARAALARLRDAAGQAVTA